MTKRIKNHSNFNSDDYAYFRAKGWGNKEIADRWDQEAAQGNSACQWNGYWAQGKFNSVVNG